MKTSLLLATLILSSSAFAAKVLEGSSGAPRITNAVVEEIVERQQNCSYVDEYEQHCAQQKIRKDVVTVTVEYTITPENYIDQRPEVTGSFKERLDLSLFSSDELEALTEKDYQLRMASVRELLALKVSSFTKTDYSAPMKAYKIEVIKK